MFGCIVKLSFHTSKRHRKGHGLATSGRHCFSPDAPWLSRVPRPWVVETTAASSRAHHHRIGNTSARLVAAKLKKMHGSFDLPVRWWLSLLLLHESGTLWCQMGRCD
jgi:hypothetical protein